MKKTKCAMALTLFSLSIPALMCLSLPLFGQPPSEFTPDENTCGLWHFNEMSGDTALDSTQYHLNGPITGATWTTGKFGGGLQFTAPGARVNLGMSALLRPAILTCEAWVYADSIRPNEMLIVTSANNDSGFALMLSDNGKPAFDCQSNGESHIALSPDSIVTGTWYHLAGTFDGDTARIWVGGLLKASIACTLWAQISYPVMVGTDVTAPYTSDPFRGKIDEVRISDTVRSYASTGRLTVLSPQTHFLHPNWPNPFNSSSTIRYEVAQAGQVRLVIFNLLGQEVARLVDGRHLAGTYTTSWDAGNLPSGLYFCQMQTGDFLQTRKMMLLK